MRHTRRRAMGSRATRASGLGRLPRSERLPTPQRRHFPSKLPLPIPALPLSPRPNTFPHPRLPNRPHRDGRACVCPSSRPSPRLHLHVATTMIGRTSGSPPFLTNPRRGTHPCLVKAQPVLRMFRGQLRDTKVVVVVVVSVICGQILMKKRMSIRRRSRC